MRQRTLHLARREDRVVNALFHVILPQATHRVTRKLCSGFTFVLASLHSTGYRIGLFLAVKLMHAVRELFILLDLKSLASHYRHSNIQSQREEVPNPRSLRMMFLIFPGTSNRRRLDAGPSISDNPIMPSRCQGFDSP